MKKILLLCCSLAIVAALRAQSFNQTWANRFQKVLDSIVVAQKIMGATAAVLVPGEGIWSGISGNSQPGVPLTPDMRFGIGSNTKLFIAVALAKLQEQGILSLDDHLSKWLPKYNNIDTSISIRQLLSHQSGVFNYTDHTDLWGRVNADKAKFWTPKDVLSYVKQPYFKPGTGWHYSNTNYILAGMIIEAATGKTWVQKLHEIIFDTLGMVSTFVGAYETPNGPTAGTQWLKQGAWYTTPITSWFSSAAAAGGILSTSREMVQWYNALFTGQIISKSSLQQILDFEAASSYGLGIWGDNDLSLSYTWFTHTGWAFSYTSQILYDINTHSVFCFINNGEAPVLRPFTEAMMHVLHFDRPKKQIDAGIIQIYNPGKHVCSVPFTPKVGLKNFGSEPLTSVRINCKLDANILSDLVWTGVLSPGDTVMVTLDAFTTGNGYHTLSYFTSDPNNAADGYIYNDTASIHFIEELSPVATFPLLEDFEGPVFPPEGWILNPDVFMQWGRTELTSFTGNACIVKNSLFDDHIGARYNIDLPIVNLTNINNPVLDFTYAYSYYAKYSMFPGDTLKVLISTDCGSSWHTIFNKGGWDLSTAPGYGDPFSNLFFPTISQWSKQSISLKGYTGNVIIRFQEKTTGNTNNLYLDDVRVEGINVGIEEITDSKFHLSNNPNPFSESTIFKYSHFHPGKVNLQIFTSIGLLVAEPVNEFQQNGEQKVIWNAESLPAGIYYCRLQADEQINSLKIIKMK